MLFNLKQARVKGLFINISRIFLVSLIVFSCKTREITVAPKKIKHLSVGRVTKLVKENALDFKTLSVKRAVLTIDNDGKSTSVRGLYKIRKDSVIQVSAQKLAIPVGKMEINPDSFIIVSYLEQENIIGSFDYISDLLGIELDFSTIQAILTGQLFSIRQDPGDKDFREFDSEIEENMYKITSITDRKLKKITKNEDRLERYRNRIEEDHLVRQDIFVDPETFVVKKMVFDDMENDRKVVFDFSKFEKVNDQWFPGLINLSFKGNNNISITFELSRITIDDDWNFNFSTSPKYKRRYLRSQPSQTLN